jgi:FKBP12-rapamycin complex-associated protein
VTLVGVQVVESTGLVMAPYLEYPQLLSVLLRMLNEGEGSLHIRREVLKVTVFSVL